MNGAVVLRPQPQSATPAEKVPLRVLLADDYAPMRIGIRAVLEGQGFAVCAEAPDAESAFAAACAERPDACVLDIKMPGDGIVAAERIAEALPDTAVVMLTASTDEQHVLRALVAGASGYVLKDTDPARLGAAVRAALRGDTVVPRELLARALETRAAGRRAALTAHDAALTDREAEVLELLCDGLSTGAIARRLFVAPVTVRSHVASIVKKLGVADRDAAVRLLSTQPATRVDDFQRR